MPKIKFKGIDVYFSDQGKGAAVVLLHGFLESSWMWEAMIPEMLRSNRVVCIDLLGHGQSDCVGYVHSMDEMAEAVEAVFKHLKLRRVDVIGHSMGGYVALALAERNPDSIRSLVLYQSTARADSDEKKLDRDRVIEAVKVNAKSFVRKSIPMLFRPIHRQKFKQKISELKSKAEQTSTRGIIAALAGMRDRPNRELLLKFPPYPVHIIAGDKDPRIPYQESCELAEISEYVALHSIEGSGHMSYIEKPEETMQVIKTILAQVK